MNLQSVLDALIDAYRGYYDIKTEQVTAPFDAEGYFSNEAQQYFLVKAAKVASVNAYEHVFFAKRESLTTSELTGLDAAAWQELLSRVKPDGDHKNTDCTLIVVTESISEEIRALVPKFSHSKNYRFGLWGFSNYRLVVIGADDLTVLTNRRGRDLTDFVKQHITNLLQKRGDET
ncbi:MAG: hypothetical protein K6E84_04535 [Lachnospiraceae bacterium]|nr:hypothetical protein [Lachnospiraceae bacterium]